MAWIFILLAGLEEVVSVIAMRHVDGLKHKKPIAVMGIGFLASFYCLSQAMQEIAIGVAYAAWAGIGTIGIAIVGIIRFKEKINLLQFVFLSLIVAGVVGLQLVT
jgi:quaternary ammonium compound-resistance protein SugE